MFDSLEEQMKHDQKAESTPKERFMVWAITAVTTVAVFGGLYYGVRMLE